MTTIYSRIAGTGSYLPPKILTNEDLSKRLDTSDDWIRTRTGIRQRHIAEPDQASSDLALPAARNALASAHISPGDVDLIIVATATPDYIFPSTACLLQAKLGIRNCAAFDVQAVCSGFVYALSVADSFIRVGQFRCALVIGAEVYSRIIDWNDRTTAVLFGDGAGAVVLRSGSSPGVLASVLHADGSYANILSVPGNICAGRIVGSPFLHMDGQAVFKFAVRVLDEAAREVCARANVKFEAIDWLIPHQANIRIMEATAKKLGFDRSKMIVTVDQHGNTSAASVPLALDLAVRDGRIRPGHKVLIEGVGGGFTWGASLIQM